jgi:hypothetical protein
MCAVIFCGLIRPRVVSAQVKRRIEHLIEREYLERSGANNKYYHYIT